MVSYCTINRHCEDTEGLMRQLVGTVMKKSLPPLVKNKTHILKETLNDQKLLVHE